MTTTTTTRRRRTATSDGPHPIDTHVGRRVRLRRELMGLSQEQLAAAVGVSFQQIQKYERGLNRLSASRLHLCAVALGVPVSFFFEDLPEAAAAPAPLAPTGFDTDDLALLRDWRRLSAAHQDSLWQVIRASAALPGRPAKAGIAPAEAAE